MEEIMLLVGIILAVCQAVKVSGLLKSRYIPLLALLLGVAGSFYFFEYSQAGLLGVLSQVLTGLVVGLNTTLGFKLVKDSLE